MTKSSKSPDKVWVLHRSPDWLVVTKRAGIATTSTVPQEKTLHSLVKAQHRDAEYVHPLSRLDVEVSGAVAFALTRYALAVAEDAKRDKLFTRTYHALVSTPPTDLKFVWDSSIGTDPKDALRRVVSPAGETARTEGVVWQRSALGAVLKLQPITGRTHQLRVHSAHAGCPIWGDQKYGGAKRLAFDNGAIVQVQRTMLHCAHVEFASEFSVHCEWPEDFASIAHAAELYSESAPSAPSAPTEQ